MQDAFEVAAGSVAGRDHVHAGRNNQDAFCLWSGPAAVVAVVADGCGSGRWSEVGAQLGSRLVVQGLRLRLERGSQSEPDRLMEDLRRSVLQELTTLAGALGERRSVTVGDLLLFTLVGAVVGPEEAFVFTLGDGVFAVNGDVHVLEAPDNAPAYLGYAVDGSPAGGDSPRFQVRRRLSTAGVESLLVATDGAADLIAARGRRVPGRAECVGPMSQLWDDDRHFANPAGLGRRLQVLNRTLQRVDWAARSVAREPGLLSDDTTVAVIRRRRRAGQVERAS